MSRGSEWSRCNSRRHRWPLNSGRARGAISQCGQKSMYNFGLSKNLTTDKPAVDQKPYWSHEQPINYVYLLRIVFF